VCNKPLTACVYVCTGFSVAVSDVAMTAHSITVEKWKQSAEMGKFGAITGIGESDSLTHLLTYLLTYSLTHLLTHLLTNLLTYLLTH
jgi:hypothetical protein